MGKNISIIASSLYSIHVLLSQTGPSYSDMSSRGSTHNRKCLDRKVFSRIEWHYVVAGRLLTQTNHPQTIFVCMQQKQQQSQRFFLRFRNHQVFFTARRKVSAKVHFKWLDLRKYRNKAEMNTRRLFYICKKYTADVGQSSCVLSSPTCFYTFFRSIPT